MVDLRSAFSVHAPRAVARPTDARRDGHAAERAASYLAAAFEATRDGMLVLGDDRECIDLNPAACELLGVSRAQAAGRRLEELATDGWTGGIVDGWDAFLERGAASGRLEQADADGKPRRVLEFDARARVAGACHLLTLRAVAGAPATQEAVAGPAGAPPPADAEEASSLKSQFMSNMNHELRTPLNGVIGISRLLEGTSLDDQQREYVRGLRASGEGLMAVIEAMLDFSRMATGDLELADEPYDLRALIEEACSFAAMSLPGTDVDVLSYVATDVPTLIRGDEQRVRQVLTALLGNGVKFTQRGEVCVTAAVGERDGAGFVRVEVADSGIGIDESAQQAIFDSFVQADGSPSRRYGGAGLGLAIARELVVRMGGEIGLRSVPGEGSTFSFTLPLRGPAADAGDPSAVLLDGVRVLAVHGSAASLRVIVRQLESWNARVATAQDGVEALERLRAAARDGDPFSVALIDHRDPRGSQLDAAELARTILADQALRSTRTVMLVAPRDAPSVAATTQADGMIHRPAGQTRLLEELTRVIGNGRRDGAGGAMRTERRVPPGSCGRVLVAEDNAVNQVVAVGLLEQRGFLVDVANNGREAIVMHAHNVYDAIFMDCQMPEINGYEATREIRRREGTKRHTPIIAMTASTLPADRDRCSAAGMDHHIGKPVRPSGLDHVIARVIPSASSAGASS